MKTKKILTILFLLVISGCMLAQEYSRELPGGSDLTIQVRDTLITAGEKAGRISAFACPAKRHRLLSKKCLSRQDLNNIK